LKFGDLLLLRTTYRV